MDIEYFLERIRCLLQDPDADRYTDNLLTEGMSWALDQISLSIPQLKTGLLTLSSSEREIALSTLGNVLGLMRVEYPYSADQLNRGFYDFLFYYRGSVPCMLLDCEAQPQADEQVKLVYCLPQTVEDLNGETITSLPVNLSTLLIWGAAGKSAELRAVHVLNPHSIHREEIDRLTQWAETQLSIFHEALHERRMNTDSLAVQPECSWRLDAWDETNEVQA